MHDASDRDRMTGTASRDDLDRAGDHARDAAHHAGEAAHHTKEAIEAGASGTLERTREAVKDTAESVSRTARHAGEKVGDAARSAAGAVTGAASTAAGAVTDAVGGMASRISDRAGGWWSAAKDAVPQLPNAELEACRVRLESAPSDEMVSEVALAAFALGYMASQNPDYRGRGFDQVEPDLRHGFSGADSGYDAWRGYTMYGYQRGSSGW
jgi:hypothetical protein